jgi:gamma-glutamylcyclotransferase (GGCT)/AIG2-like uncharacterized protein YtfP
MAYRCPKAEPICRAKISDWRLVFRGVADIEPSEGDVVHGAIWSLSQECEDELDLYEGYPSFYGKHYVKRADGSTVLVYIMTNTHGGRISPPSGYYLDGIKEGFEDFELDTSPLELAVAHSLEEVNGYGRGHGAALKPTAKKNTSGGRRLTKRERKNRARAQAAARKRREA